MNKDTIIVAILMLILVVLLHFESYFITEKESNRMCSTQKIAEYISRCETVKLDKIDKCYSVAKNLYCKRVFE